MVRFHVEFSVGVTLTEFKNKRRIVSLLQFCTVSDVGCLPVLFPGCQDNRLRAFENSAEYLDSRGEGGSDKRTEKICVMRTFMIYTLHQILLG
jgi:hypothetical protein